MHQKSHFVRKRPQALHRDRPESLSLLQKHVSVQPQSLQTYKAQILFVGIINVDLTFNSFRHGLN